MSNADEDRENVGRDQVRLSSTRTLIITLIAGTAATLAAVAAGAMAWVGLGEALADPFRVIAAAAAGAATWLAVAVSFTQKLLRIIR